MRLDGDFKDVVMLAGEQVVGGNGEIQLTARGTNATVLSLNSSQESGQ
jgi:hypothetical protein